MQWKKPDKIMPPPGIYGGRQGAALHFHFSE